MSAEGWHLRTGQMTNPPETTRPRDDRDRERVERELRMWYRFWRLAAVISVLTIAASHAWATFG